VGSLTEDASAFRPRVLIVDDTAANLIAFRTVLESPRREIDLASTGQEALSLAFDRDYSVMLIDIRMPGLDGAELATLLRSRPRSAHTPIIFMSAYDNMPYQVTKGILVGAFDFVLTPTEPDILRRKVEAFEAMHRLRHELVERIRVLQAENLALREKMAAGPSTDRNPSSAVLAPIDNPLAQRPPRAD
jgi:CheY-like chemotaxis protein